MAPRKRYRRRRSHAGQVVNDVAYIANRLSWKSAALLGAVLFVIFYWAIPAWLASRLAVPEGNQLRAAADIMLFRPMRWSEWVGIASALVSRIVARLLD